MKEILYFNINNITGERYCAMREALPDEMITHAENHIMEKDRYLSVAGGYLLTVVLKRSGFDIKKLKIKYGDYGKPYFEGKEVYFNISHSEEISVCVVSDGEVGVDIQKEITPSDALIKRVCTLSEQERIFSLDGNKRKTEFTRLWVAKESYMKYCGEGFRLPMNKQEIDFCNPLQIKVNGTLCSIVFNEYTIEDYRLTVCGKDDFSATVPQEIM